MVDTDEVLLIDAAYSKLTFNPAQAAHAYSRLRDAARAIENDEEYDNVTADEEKHNVQVTQNLVDPDGRCSICSERLGDESLFTHVRDEEREINNNLCADCTEDLADELERYVEKNGDRLGEAL